MVGYSTCPSGCTFTDGDPQNCGGCNLKCPTGSLCKSGKCEVRIGYPNRFTGNEASLFQAPTGQVTASALTLAKQSTLLALGFINASTTVGAVATFGLYNDSARTPAALVASAPGVTLHTSVQEIAVSNVVLVPGTYYFAILPRDEGEPKIYTSPNASPAVDFWYGGPASYASGLPSSFASLASEVFSDLQTNVYLVVTQPGG